MLRLVWLCALTTAVLAAGCRAPESGEAPAERLVAVEATAALLPTPTLAFSGTVDPLNPPTPIVLSSPTPLAGETAGEVAEPAGAPDASVTAPVDPTPLPTPALPPDATPAELLALGRRALAEGDDALAVAAFRAVLDAPGDLADDDIAAARLGFAVALLAEGHANEATAELEAVAQQPQSRTADARSDALVAPLNVADAAAFHLGRARAVAGDQAGAVEAYSAYLANNPDMAAYVQPLIADAHEARGDTPAVIAALTASLDAPAQRFQVVANRLRLAALHLAGGDYAAAIAQYDAIHDIARTEATKGQMTFLAGQAEIMAGNTAAGHERFLTAVADYPRAVESYQALLALVEAGVPVDEYQRGVVDYYIGVYQPAVEALLRYLANPPAQPAGDAHLFLAWSYEGLGDVDNGLAALDAFAEIDPARALFERGELLRRAGRTAEAIAAYDAYLADDPDADNAAAVVWSAARLADDAGQPDAAGRYLALADDYPFDPNTPLALYRAAELREPSDADEAQALRQRLIDQYPANVHAAEALFRLLKDERQNANLSAQAGTLTLSNYFALRAADLAAGVMPFSADSPMTLPETPDAGREEAEAWLREQLTAAGTPPAELSGLSPALAADPQRIIGEKLWQLGLLEEAKAELEAVREQSAGDVAATYQLARYFGELGLYRSSIVAAASLLQQMGVTAFDAPPYLGRLAYPAYYADLILPLADQYDFVPRLQFALVRQESLFESFARSGAAAQGLSQVIPDTGAWIAQRLQWPGFKNEDLYKPYVGLHFGAYYLSEQLNNFDGHVHAALAAYNGGPGNAARWFQTAGSDHDLFVDTVDFPETRLYIERIYEGFNAYRHLYRQ
jgi:soluble lytic murein transglycosylase